MNRRMFLRNGGIGLVVAPALGARAVVDLTKPPPPVLPPIMAGTVLSASTLNAMVDAINELRAGQLS